MLGWLPLLAWTVGSYQLEGATTTYPEPELSRVEYRWMADSETLNRFAITRVRRTTGCAHEQSPVILFSPFMLPGAFYEIAESGAYAESAAGRLAMDGYDVWLVDQRRTGLSPGACERGEADCGVMGDWDFDASSDDGLLVLSMVRAAHPSKKPVVGGFSAGSNSAMALANRAPHAIDGLFLYEGTFFTTDPEIRAHNVPICNRLDAALAQGSVFDPSASIYGPLLSLAETDPAGISPIPVFPPGTTNQQAMLYVFSAPPPPSALSPTPGFVRCIADFATQQFVHANPQRLFRVGPLFDNYAPIAAMRDLACGLSGSDSRHYDRLEGFRGDLLVFVEGTGFGQAMFDTVELFGRARSVTVEHRPDLGEADPYFHHAWADVFYAPLKSWLSRVSH